MGEIIDRAVERFEKAKACKHDGLRHGSTTIVSHTKMRRMEWCDLCGSLLYDREWNIPLPVESQSQ